MGVCVSSDDGFESSSCPPEQRSRATTTATVRTMVLRRNSDTTATTTVKPVDATTTTATTQKFGGGDGSSSSTAACESNSDAPHSSTETRGASPLCVTSSPNASTSVLQDCAVSPRGQLMAVDVSGGEGGSTEVASGTPRKRRNSMGSKPTRWGASCLGGNSFHTVASSPKFSVGPSPAPEATQPNATAAEAPSTPRRRRSFSTGQLSLPATKKDDAAVVVNPLAPPLPPSHHGSRKDAPTPRGTTISPSTANQRRISSLNESMDAALPTTVVEDLLQPHRVQQRQGSTTSINNNFSWNPLGVAEATGEDVHHQLGILPQQQQHRHSLQSAGAVNTSGTSLPEYNDEDEYDALSMGGGGAVVGGGCSSLPISALRVSFHDFAFRLDSPSDCLASTYTPVVGSVPTLVVDDAPPGLQHHEGGTVDGPPPTSSHDAAPVGPSPLPPLNNNLLVHHTTTLAGSQLNGSVSVLRRSNGSSTVTDGSTRSASIGGASGLMSCVPIPRTELSHKEQRARKALT